MTAREEMGDPIHLRVREDLADELELGAARRAVPRGDREDGAVVLDDSELAVG